VSAPDQSPRGPGKPPSAWYWLSCRAEDLVMFPLCVLVKVVPIVVVWLALAGLIITLLRS
jgi:hypothetical protein